MKCPAQGCLTHSVSPRIQTQDCPRAQALKGKLGAELCPRHPAVLEVCRSTQASSGHKPRDLEEQSRGPWGKSEAGVGLG